MNGSNRSDDLEPIEQIVEAVAHLLPAQGPISVFIHHNTLHAFEHLPFETAVVRAGELFGCEPFLTEARYRAELACGRIREADIHAELSVTLGERGGELVAGLIQRLELRRRVVAHGIPEARGQALTWMLAETEVLERFRDDIPADAREIVAAARGWSAYGSADEPGAVSLLWRSCVAAIERSSATPRARVQDSSSRPRDWLLTRHGLDIDACIEPVLIRFVAGFLDQGLAQLPMRGRERGMYACFLDTFDTRLAQLCGPWAGELPALIRDQLRGRDPLHPTARSASESLVASLDELGIASADRHEFLRHTALALRGFAGMTRQIEARPDRVPAHAVPATLLEFLAVRLLLERAALRHAARCHAVTVPLARWCEQLRASLPEPPLPSASERAWQLFHLAQLCGFDTSLIAVLEPEQIADLERELEAFNEVSHREILHRAYERHLRQRFFDVLETNPLSPTRERPPAFQAVFCLDEREESMRRHIEELEPEVETFGAAGFYGVAMYYRGATDAHPRPLCPVVIRPEHFVAETHEDRRNLWSRWQRWRRRGRGLFDKSVHFGSHTLFRGAVVMTAIGALSLIPLVVRVLFPRLRPKVAQLDLGAGPRTRLLLERRDEAPPIGRYAGFTVDEMQQIVATALENLGIVAPSAARAPGRFAPLVLFVGHGSSSLNNPHESAYDCGACGGGRGGPNARALAQMANDPRVRSGLAARGIEIPSGTWFVGAQRNTSNNEFLLFDTDLVPAVLAERLAHVREVLEHARRREAHERCRRFELARVGLSSAAALRHVEGRAADLAQPRPEAGHATNAVTVIGRRDRTRGLYFDRRAFLVSYDPTHDDDARILTRLLAAVVPVIAGINLEYYFSYVDQAGYGAGTKLPHNVTSLLGVMDGAQSDLRTGLPWQMVEIHEPVRMTIVIEARPERVKAALEQAPAIQPLISNRWLFLACLDPESNALWELGPDGFSLRTGARPVPVIHGPSRAVYRGRRGHMPFSRLVGSST